MEHGCFVSVVLPAFNEENSISLILHNIYKILIDLNVSFELILIDDGSSDKTYEHAIKCLKFIESLKVFKFDKNCGKGAALKYGFYQATGEIVVFIDSDMEIDPHQIRKYITALEYADIAIASKYIEDSKVVVSRTRKYLSIIFHYLVRLLTGLNVKDTQAGLKSFKRDKFIDVFNLLTVKRFAFDVELLVIANKFNMKIVELPVELTLNKTYFHFKDIFMMLCDLLSISYKLHILNEYQF